MTERSEADGASAGHRSPLLPPFLALGVLLALQFLAQLFQVGLGIAGDADYRPPYPLAHMSKTHSDFDMLDAANAAYIAGAPDFDGVRQQARQIDEWRRIYPYPPLAYRLLAGVSRLPVLAKHFVWLALTLALVILSLVVFARQAMRSDRATRAAVVLITLLCLSQSTPFLFQVERGNFDWLALSLCLLALVALAGGRALPAGALLGVAVSLKVYPFFLVGTLACLRRWRSLIACGATIALAVIVLGPRDHLQWLRFLVGDRAQSFGAHPSNVSLANLLSSVGLARGDALVPATGGLFLALSAAFLLAIVWRSRRQAQDALRVGAFSLGFMFLVPLVHWAYTLFALLALLPVLARVYPEQPRLRWPVLLAAAAVGVLQAPITAPRFHPALLPLVMPLYSATLLCLVLLSIWLVARGACDAPRATPAVSV